MLKINKDTCVLNNRMQRTFHTVGQGAFYSEVFRLNGGRTYSVVYDCGTETSAENLSRQISDFAKGLNPYNQKIDLLFLSHLHHDHISGLGELITTLPPQAIVLPMLPMNMILTNRIANLISLGPAGIESDNLIQDLYLGNHDGEEGARRFDNIIGVEPADGEVGSNERLYPSNAKSLEDGACKLEEDEGSFWRYRPFNSVSAQDERAKRFIENVRQIPGLLVGDTLNVNEVWAKKSELRTAYKEAMNSINDNLYTLVVESEPLEEVREERDESLAGCVYFGDYVPGKDRWNRFRLRVDDFNEKVGVIQAPHHGGKGNWRHYMLGKNVKHCIVSAGVYNRYQHPNYWVVNEIENAGVKVHVVSEDPTSVAVFNYAF